MEILIYSIAVAVVILFTIIIVAVTRKNKNLDKTSEVLYELLPNLNCGECGRQDCMKFAEDLSKGKTVPDQCPYLKDKNYLKIRRIMKKERRVHFENVAFVKCKGGCDCENKFEYVGDKTCASKSLKHGGDKFCPFACQGCGDCINACKYGAISISDKGCAIVDKDKCVGCGECVFACPKRIIELVPSKKFVDVVCKNTSTDSVITRNCKVSCTHCEACVVACPVGAIKMVGGLPKIDPNKCVKCGKCVAVCPSHVISRI